MTCKDIDIIICPFCARKNEQVSCWIDYYKNTISKKMSEKYIKEYILYSLDYPDTIYLYAAIKLYYPKYQHIYEKLSILV